MKAELLPKGAKLKQRQQTIEKVAYKSLKGKAEHSLIRL